MKKTIINLIKKYCINVIINEKNITKTNINDILIDYAIYNVYNNTQLILIENSIKSLLLKIKLQQLEYLFQKDFNYMYDSLLRYEIIEEL